jgi:two-component sensor histidine kinase
VKNNLNVAVSLLSLQSGAEGGKSADDVLRDAESRLRTMLELYESLHARESDGDLPLRAYLASIVDEIVLLYPRDPPVRVELDVDDTVLGAETLSALGLIVNELMTNSLKHAFAAAADPAIFIRARSAGGRVELSCGDNGIGISPDARPDATGGFGMRVVSMLASQLKADVRLAREKGTTWFFSFPGSTVRG